MGDKNIAKQRMACQLQADFPQSQDVGIHLGKGAQAGVCQGVMEALILGCEQLLDGCGRLYSISTEYDPGGLQDGVHLFQGVVSAITADGRTLELELTPDAARERL